MKSRKHGQKVHGEKRGIQQGVAKHKVRSKPVAGNVEAEGTLLGISESTYCSMARRSFDFWLFCCDKLYLAPFKRTATGVYVPLEWKSKVMHYFAWLLMFLILLHKVWGLTV